MNDAPPSFSMAFICTANVCRSVMAHAICVPELAERGWTVEVYSAGTMDLTGAAPALPTWITCCQNSTPPQKDGATFVRDLPLASIQRFLVMERKHATVLIADYGIPPDRIVLLGTWDPKSKSPEIEDPINQGAVAFEQCHARIRRCIRACLDTTTEIPGTPNYAPPGTVRPSALKSTRRNNRASIK